MIQYNNFLIKREQSRAGSRFAECEKSRLKAKILMTLALLLTAVTGAWATDGVIMKELTVPSEWNGAVTNLTVDDLPGFKDFSSLTDDEAKALLNSVPAGNVLIIYGAGASSNSFKIVQSNGTKVAVGESPLSHKSIFDYKDNYKFYYTTSDAIEVIPVAVPAANTKQWTFYQPGSDVVLTPIYAPTAAWAEVETVKQLPEAAEGVIAGTDAPLIAEGTGIVATTMIGETPTAQGTVMYAVTAATANEAPELDAADTWSADVPTAEDVADDGAEVKVWYYIQGADTPDGETATAENTFNNSEVSSLTVTVLSNKFDLTLNPANANTIEAGKATVTVKVGDAAAVDKTEDITNGKLTGIKMGSEVKLNAKQGYKFRKVEVKKTVKTIKIGDQDYTVLDGETWKQFITRNQLSGWTVAPNPDTTWYVYNNKPSYKLRFKSDGNNWEMLVLTSEDAPIDTDKQYTLGYD